MSSKSKVICAAVLWWAVGGIASVYADGQIVEIKDSLPAGASFLPMLPAISADGRVVAGAVVSGTALAYRWTEEGAVQDIGVLAGHSFPIVGALNADGTVILGTSLNAGGQREAYLWTQGSGMQALGSLGGETEAYGINANGSVAVGQSYDSVDGQYRAFRWTQAGGMVSLGTLAGSTGTSIARGISADGTVIVGFSDDAGGRPEAFRWTQSGGMQQLDVTSNYSDALAISADGAVVVGSNRFSGYDEAFRWTQAAGMQALGLLPGKTQSKATAVNADGSVVVGDSWAGGGSSSSAFRWTETDGLQTINQWLDDNEVEVAPGFEMSRVSGVSADGLVVVGLASDNRPLLVRVDGAIALDEYAASLQGNTVVLGSLAMKSEMLMHGLHSNPLSRRVAPGERCFRIGGDWGYDDHEDRDGRLGMAEATGCYNFGQVQLNISLGKSWASEYDLYQNGDLDADAIYVVGELLAPMHKLGDSQLWGALTVFYSHGEADIKRGYLNAGTAVSSKGSPDTNSTGVRSHFEWDNALQLSSTRINPYASVSYFETSVDSYTETGGGFPARFNKATGYSADLRLGLQGLTRIDDRLRVTSQLEGVHSNNDDGYRLSGEASGVTRFELEGPDSKQSWLKLGLGIEYDVIENALFSINLNGTTEGQAPSIWLSTGYQYSF
ncbi:autotransporter domain-containing protein [Aestuariirhabdus haliotis]|uniref:autotransporter domain-containing protein n=1 Tax=Aestuariirhabdus haliotis TaxID=2918751 RepID=UPI0020C07572|nr:autotransporter domain-containing protein [Aestuariirhabdus haliotis]MCL6420733.1 autotransporter domain-containing protein [Aestuariirhabdus haliotis]